jgi:hypothetical protein
MIWTKALDPASADQPIQAGPSDVLRHDKERPSGEVGQPILVLFGQASTHRFDLLERLAAHSG